MGGSWVGQFVLMDRINRFGVNIAEGVRNDNRKFAHYVLIVQVFNKLKIKRTVLIRTDI